MKGKIRIILDELRDIERTEGLGAITEGKINEICNDYRFYFYHHMYIPAWESNFYGVVK